MSSLRLMQSTRRVLMCRGAVTNAMRSRTITTTVAAPSVVALCNNNRYNNSNNNNNISFKRGLQTSRAYFDLPDHEVIAVPALSPTMEQGMQALT